MSLYFKEDWDQARNMMTGWWNREIRGRWALGVLAPRDIKLTTDVAAPPSDNFREQWLDYRNSTARREQWFSEHCYLGCAYPEHTAYLGPGSLNAFLGCAIDFQATTVWFHPAASDPEKVDQMTINTDGFYWQWTIEALTHIRHRAAGRYVVAMPDLIEGLDILSEYLGTNELLLHLVDCPGEVHRLLDQLDNCYFEAYDALADIIKGPDGSVPYTVFNTWGPGRTAKVQCDFSAMISPDMFAEFVLPHLGRQCRRLDYTMYHLDGPNAVKHLDLILSIPELTAIQWTPGAGNPHCADKIWWEPVWNKVYASGKSAFLHGVPPEAVEPFVKEFGTVGTLIKTEVETEKQAYDLMDKSLDW